MYILAPIAFLLIILGSSSSASDSGGVKTWSYLGKSGPIETVSPEYNAINEWLSSNTDEKLDPADQLSKAREYLRKHEDQIEDDALRSAWKRFVALGQVTKKQCTRESVEILIDNMGWSGLRTKQVQQDTRVANIVDTYVRKHAIACQRVYLERYNQLRKRVDETMILFAETLDFNLQHEIGLTTIHFDKNNWFMKYFFKQVEKGSISPIAKAFAQTISELGDENEKVATSEDFDVRGNINAAAIRSGVAKVFDNCAKYVETLGELTELIEFDAEIYNRYDFFATRLTNTWSAVQVCKRIERRDKKDIANNIIARFKWMNRRRKFMAMLRMNSA